MDEPNRPAMMSDLEDVEVVYRMIFSLLIATLELRGIEVTKHILSALDRGAAHEDIPEGMRRRCAQLAAEIRDDTRPPMFTVIKGGLDEPA